MSNKRKTVKLDFIKIKNYYASKDTTKKWKDNPQNGIRYMKIMYLIEDVHLYLRT